MDNKGNLVRNYYIKGILETLSPLKISSGNDEYSGNDLQKNWDNIPFIPGTSIAGVLKNELSNHIDNVEAFFGTGSKESKISNIITYDVFPNGNDQIDITVRDGVCIDNQYKTGVDKKKHDYEVIETGSKFNFKIEVRKYENELAIDNAINSLMGILSQGFTLGSKGTRGFGKVVIKDLQYLDLDVVNDIDSYINFSWYTSPFKKYESEDTTSNNAGKMNISLDLKIDTSLIVREYYKGEDDTVSLTSRDKYVIPGTSIAGILRHGMYDILLELSEESKATKITNNLFGHVNESKKTASKSRICVEESIIKETQPLKIVRNRIDRFTGKTIETALFDSKPVFGGKFTLNLTIDKPSAAEEALTFMVLNDLCNGIIGIGGERSIGRGNVSRLKMRINDKEECLSKYPTDEQCKSLQHAIEGGE